MLSAGCSSGARFATSSCLNLLQSIENLKPPRRPAVFCRSLDFNFCNREISLSRSASRLIGRRFKRQIGF
jgi:hypothetical protein